MTLLSRNINFIDTGQFADIHDIPTGTTERFAIFQSPKDGYIHYYNGVKVPFSRSDITGLEFVVKKYQPNVKLEKGMRVSWFKTGTRDLVEDCVVEVVHHNNQVCHVLNGRTLTRIHFDQIHWVKGPENEGQNNETRPRPL